MFHPLHRCTAPLSYMPPEAIDNRGFGRESSADTRVRHSPRGFLRI